MAKGRSIVAYQLQMIASVSTDILCDLGTRPPLGNHAGHPHPFIKGIRCTSELENVGMREAVPQDDLFAEALRNV